MGGGRDSNLARVNGESITLAEYQKKLNNALNEESRDNPALLSDARLFGEYKRQVLNEIMWAKARNLEAQRLGLLVTPHELKKYLHSLSVFHDAEGKFSEELYRKTLESIQLTSDQLLGDLENELLDNKFISYISMSSGISDKELKAQHDFNMERRSADYVLFTLDEYRAKAEVSEDDIAAAYESGKESYRRPNRANLEYLLITPQTLAKGYPVSDADAEAYYKEHTEEFRSQEMFQARLLAISAPPENSTEPGAEELSAKARAKMDEALAKLKAGEDFGELAKAYSDDQGSARLGGLLPWLEVGDTGHASLNQAIKSLKPGEVSEVLRSPLGFHVIKMEGKKPSALSPFAEVAEGIKGDLARRRAEENFPNAQKEAEDGLRLGTSFAELGTRFKLAPAKSGLRSEAELKALLGLSKDYAAVLDNAIAEALASGNATPLPAPLNLEEGIALVRILETSPSHVPALDAVREEVRVSLLDAKGAELARAAADQALPSFTGQDAPEEYRSKIVRSAGATRGSDSVEPLGPAPELTAQLFFSKGGWMPQVFATPKGPVIAKLGSVEKSTPEQWEENRARGYGDIYRQWQVNTIVQAYLENLNARTIFEPNYATLDLIGRQQ